MSKILILEDDIILGNDFCSALKRRGYEVHLACTASEAFEYCKANPVWLAVVDIFIKQGDRYIPDGGLSFIAKIRNLHLNPALRDIPIIAISGGALTEGAYDPLLSAISIGATATLRKPVEISELVAKVDEILGLN